MLLLSVKTIKLEHTKVDIFNMEHKREAQDPEFKEKIWGKTIEGEYVIDGYTFRGKRIFKKAYEGIKVFMKKGAMKEVNKIKITVLDVRKNGGADDIEIELIENISRGKALIKLYGPNSNNENVIMVSKSKQSEYKYVKILAEKVLKPLIRDFIAENIEFDENEEETEETEKPNDTVKKPEVLECPFCDKTSYSSPGLKCHITKMHKDIEKDKELKQNEVKAENSDEKIENLLDDSVKTLVTLEEVSSDMIVDDTSSVKMYSQECKNCDFKTKAERNYIALRLVKKHSDSCPAKKFKKSINNDKCNECDYVAINGQQMKRHMRDQHDSASVSTSPPPKKIKIVSKEMFGNDAHDSDDYMDDINSSLEDMDIDDTGVKDESIGERSNGWDQKVRIQQKKIMDVIKSEENKMKASESKEILEEEEIVQNQKKEKKQIKQKRKDSNKRKNKRARREAMESTPRKINPNIKSIPMNCTHLVNENDVVYTVPGDGACGPSSASIFLFDDESFGPKLRIKMNKFQAEHWEKRYKNITPCSAQTPFVRKLKGGKTNFSDPVKLKRFLKHSRKAAYMWTDSEDLAVISDLYQVEIKIITTTGPSDKNPTVNYIHPSLEMAEFSEHKNENLKEIVLLHEKDMHFNPIISKDSEVATYGSISYRLTAGVNIDSGNETFEEDVDKEIIVTDNNSQNELKELNKAVKDSTGRIKVIEEEYIQCEKELRKKTEESEKLKSELKDLKQILKLAEELKQVENESCDITVDNQSNEEEALITSNESGSNESSCTKNNPQVKKNRDHKDVRKCMTNAVEEFNCSECDFQGAQQSELSKHIRLKHTIQNGI